MSIYPQSKEKPSPTIYPAQTLSSQQNMQKAMLKTIGATEDRPFVVGKRVVATIDFADTGAQNSTDVEVAVTGAKVGDQVIVGGPVPAAATFFSGFVSEDDVVKVRFNNYSDGAVNPAEAEFVITVIPSI